MKWLVIPIEELKQFDKDWKTRRTSNDGTKALLHEEMYNMLIPPVITLEETNEVREITYPYPLVDEEEIINSGEWVSDEVIWFVFGMSGNSGILPGSRFFIFLFYCTPKNSAIFRVRVNCLIITYHFLLFLKNIMSLKERLC